MDSNFISGKKRMAVQIIAVLLCLFAVASGASAANYSADASIDAAKPEQGGQGENATAEPFLIYQGQPFARREGVRTILLMGIDWPDTEVTAMDRYRNGGQADFLLLVIIDDENKQVLQWQIDRDSIVDITMLGLMGDDAGLIKAQICLSHSYGDGKGQSCQYTVEAVQRLLKHVTVDYYAAMSIDDVGALNDAVGGVVLTIEDDFTEFEPEMAPGTTLRLTGSQAELFVQRRWDIADGSNVSRMWRHRTFLAALLRQAEEMIRENPAAMQTLVSHVLKNLVTDMNLVSIFEEANKALSYQRMGMEMLEGEHVMSPSGYVEFYVDTEALEKRIVDTFFVPMAPNSPES